MTRSEFIAELRKEVEAFDKYFAERYPLLGAPIDDKDKPEDSRGELGYGDWFDQFLMFNMEEE